MTAGRVLIIDDDERLAAMVARYLAKSGFTSVSAGTRAGGLALLSREKPDVLILDIMLPTSTASRRAGASAWCRTCRS